MMKYVFEFKKKKISEIRGGEQICKKKFQKDEKAETEKG